LSSSVLQNRKGFEIASTVSRQGEILNIDYLTLDLFDPTLQAPGLQGTFEYTLVSHCNPCAGNTAEKGIYWRGFETRD